MAYEYRRKIARDAIAASSGEVREKIDAAEVLLWESQNVYIEAEEMLKRAEELKKRRNPCGIKATMK